MISNCRLLQEYHKIFKKTKKKQKKEIYERKEDVAKAHGIVLSCFPRSIRSAIFTGTEKSSKETNSSFEMYYNCII